jgi:acetolactate synthase I/II/III large subunit
MVNKTDKDSSKENVSVSRYLISRIADLGIDFIPGITGGAIMKIIDEIGLNEKIEYVLPSHEQALSMMVDAYARLKGFGVGVVTSGPGGTNLTTGIACAYYDSVPCLFITGQVGMFHVKGDRNVRQRGFQETDNAEIVKSITKYSVMITDPQDVKYEFEKAIYLAKSGRPGPVLIDLPYNVQRSMINPQNLRSFIPPEKDVSSINLVNSINKIIKNLEKSSRPLIIAGGGVRISEQTDNLYKLINKTSIPVVATWSCSDMFTDDNDLYFGKTGIGGNPCAVSAIQESDYILALGTRFPTKVIMNEKYFAKDANITCVDIDQGELENSLIYIKEKINTDLSIFIPQLLNNVKNDIKKDNWIQHLTDKKEKKFKINAVSRDNKNYLNPYELLQKLFSLLPHNSVIVPDCGCNLIWSVQSYSAKTGQRFFTSWGHSPMGYSLPAALGAWYAKKTSTIVGIIGDGGVQMNIQELATVSKYQIPVKLFILNNQCFGNTKFATKAEFEGRTTGNEVGQGYTPANYKKLADCYNIEYNYLENNKDLERNLTNIISTNSPIIVEVNVDPEQYVFENKKITPE